MNIAIKVDPEKCTGCGACRLECSFAHYRSYNPKMAGNVIKRIDYGTFIPTFCQHCNESLCIKACPTGAIYRAEDGRVLINLEDCIGCEACYEACPIKAINILNEKAYKCDLCDGKPKCVDVCLPGAITIEEIDNFLSRSIVETIEAHDSFLKNREREGEK